MTEPILTASDLKPLFQLLFRHRFRAILVFVLTTVLVYSALQFVKVAKFESVAVVMVKVPIVDYQFQINPNPQVASAYVDLAQADALLFDTHALAVELHRVAEPLASELGITFPIDSEQRDEVLRGLRRKEDLPAKLAALAEQFEVEWQKNLLSEVEFFLGLFEIEEETLDQIPLYVMQESFNVKVDIAQQTNVSFLSQHFLNFRVRWNSPGSSSVFANIWARLFEERANDLAERSGLHTETSLMREADKIDGEMEELKQTMAGYRGQPEYQTLREVESLENALYGTRSKFDMFGYVEIHADIAMESGLVGQLADAEMARAKAESEANAHGEAAASAYGEDLPAEVAERQKSLDSQSAVLASQSASMRSEVERMIEQARGLREKVSEFDATYQQTQFEIDKRNRLMAERLTTAAISSTRLKTGYSAPPVTFAERSVPSRHPTGPSKAILAIVVGFLAMFAYFGWVIYRGMLVPAAS